MVHLGIYATLLEFTYKCGANVSATAVDQLFADSFLTQAEATINVTCRKTFATTAAEFALLPAPTRQLLTSVSSDLAAIYAIQFDMSGFTSRAEAEDMITTLRDSALRGLAILRDRKNHNYLKTGVLS